MEGTGHASARLASEALCVCAVGPIFISNTIVGVPIRSSFGGHSAALTCSMVAFTAEFLSVQSVMVGWPSKLLVLRRGKISGSTLINIGVRKHCSWIEASVSCGRTYPVQ